MMFVHAGSFQDAGVIQAAYSFNTPLLVLKHSALSELATQQVITSSEPSVIIETVKVRRLPLLSGSLISVCSPVYVTLHVKGKPQTNLTVVVIHSLAPINRYVNYFTLLF